MIPLLIWAVANFGLITPNAVVGALSGLLGGLFTDGSPRGMAALLLAAAIGVAVADRLRPNP